MKREAKKKQFQMELEQRIVNKGLKRNEQYNSHATLPQTKQSDNEIGSS